MNHERDSQRPANSRWKIVLIAFILIGAYFLITEHRAHVIDVLPYLLLLACPLLHLFGHSHGGHAAGDKNEKPSRPAARGNDLNSGTRDRR